MNLLSLSLRNILAKPLQTALSVVLFALGIALISLMLSLRNQISHRLTRNIQGVDLVIGAKGSPLQMVMSSVYHIDEPTGNIPYAQGQLIARIKMFEKVVPEALGDNVKGFPIVGTTQGYPELYNATLASGKWWADDMQATIGAAVAQRTGLKPGDQFFGSHGVMAHEDFPYTVTGVMAPSNTVIDQLVFTNVSSVWKLHDHHDAKDTTHTAKPAIDTTHKKALAPAVADTTHKATASVPTAHPNEQAFSFGNDHATSDITAYLITYKKDERGNPASFVDPAVTNILRQFYPNVGYAHPYQELNRLTELTGIGITALNWIGLIFLIVSVLSVFISLYSSLRERRFELAQMRVMGASPVKLFTMVILEGLLIAVLGYTIGVVLSHTGMAIMAQKLEDAYRYSFHGFFYLEPEELLMFFAALVLGFVAAFIPAVQAYTVNISKTLSRK